MRAASFAMSIAKADVNSAMPLDDRHAPARNRLARLHHRDLLVLAQRAVLAHGAADDEARHAVADQALHDARGGVDVERKIFAKLRRHRRKYATPIRFQSPSPKFDFRALPAAGNLRVFPAKVYNGIAKGRQAATPCV